MPVSDKNFDEILYDLLPKMYHEADRQAQPIEAPLKRFLQVASIGLEKVEGEIDGLQLLFNTDFMPEKYLDPVGRMLGFKFPEFTTVEEKRRLIKNLPTLYKMKGNDLVFDMLARLLFHRDAKTSTEWIYDEYSTTVKIGLEIGESSTDDIEGKRQRYLELIEFFRPVNVGTAWKMIVFYDDFAELGKSEDNYDLTTLLIDDNLNKFDRNTALLNSNRTIGDNFMIYGGNKIPEIFNVKKSTDEYVDRLHFTTIVYDIPVKIEETLTLDRLNFATEVEDFEIYPLDVGGSDVIVDYRNMLNYGILGSTLVLNNLPKVTTIGG